MAKDKENDIEIKNIEKKLRAWENGNAYPTLDEIYVLGDYIKINPGELLALRNRGRKEFLRDTAEYQVNSKFTVNSKMSHGFDRLSSILILISVILFIFITFKLVNRVSNKQGIEQKVIVNQIETFTETEKTDNPISNIVNNFVENTLNNTINNTVNEVQNIVEN